MKANTTKTNKALLTLSEMTELIQTSVVGTKCKTFTDSTNYIGFGVKANGFSVNVKKTKYNIYCNDANFDLLAEGRYAGCEFTKGGNSVDKTRPNYILCTSTEAVKKMIAKVIESQYKVAADAN